MRLPKFLAFFFALALSTVSCPFVFAEAADLQSEEQATYEKIYHHFIKEDYKTAYQLANRYLHSQKPGARYEDIQYLEALSLIKLGKTEEGNQKFEALENRPAAVVS